MSVKSGDNVSVHYTGKLSDGTLFDTSEGREPLAFTAGSGMVIPGFDNALIGMSVGEKKTVLIPCQEAYGPRSEEAVFQVSRTELPPDIEPQVGLELSMGDDKGNIIPVLVVGVDDTTVTIDANHPLAGQDLTFDLELVSIS